MGSRQIVLYRDGRNTPWGFRLQGGTDVGYPLTVQRITIGSPSEGELRRGDIITRIGNKDATLMTHHGAHNAITSAGNNLNLTVLRAGQSIPVQNSHPPPLHPTYYATPYLPKTEFTHEFRRFVPPPPQNNPAALNVEEYVEKEMERQQIVGQPHRTFPLITPSIKVKHDVPTGSYLRFVNDPFARTNDARMKAKVHETVLNASAAMSTGSSPARSSTPEILGTIGQNANIVHRQYNSPLHLYSHQNVLDTIAGQTGVTPKRKGEIRFFDITKSPTYQAIYDDEWKTLRAKDLSEHKPVQNQVKRVYITQPVHYEDAVNPLGVPKDKILQSRSFDMIKNTLTTGQTDF